VGGTRRWSPPDEICFHEYAAARFTNQRHTSLRVTAPVFQKSHLLNLNHIASGFSSQKISRLEDFTPNVLFHFSPPVRHRWKTHGLGTVTSWKISEFGQCSFSLLPPTFSVSTSTAPAKSDYEQSPFSAYILHQSFFCQSRRRGGLFSSH